MSELSRDEVIALNRISADWPPRPRGLADALANHVSSDGTMSDAGRSELIAGLEDALAAAHGCRFGLAMSSGTSALQAAFFAAELQPGDEVVAVAYSYHATVSPLMHAGVRIIFCDIEPDTGNISVADLEKKITPQTRAVVTNHQWGHPVDVDGIRMVLDGLPHRPVWVEDCSHAHFAEYEGQRVGSFGDVSVFSLQGNKLVPAGEGGVLLTNSERMHDLATLWAYSLKRTEQCVIDPGLRALGRTGLGLKHRMHPLAAVTARYYLDHHVPEWLRSRNALLAEFSELLAPIPGIEPPVTRPYVSSRGAFYGYKPRFVPAEIGGKYDMGTLVRALGREGLAIKMPGSPPLYDLPLFTRSPVQLPTVVEPVPDGGLPGAEEYCRSIMSFPTFTLPEERALMRHYATVIRRVTESLLAGKPADGE